VWKGANLGDYRMVLYALALILMMILRPQGLLGIHELWEIDAVKRLVSRFRRTKPAPAPSAPRAEGGGQ
jgi:hypothetical protein